MTLSDDPLGFLTGVLLEQLQLERVEIVPNGRLRRGAGWRPFILEESPRRAWHIVHRPPQTDGWVDRLARVKDADPDLKIACLLPHFDDLEDEAQEPLLDVLDRLEAAVRFYRPVASSVEISKFYWTVSDLIWGERFRLSAETSQILLDRMYERARTAEQDVKGNRFEELCALLVSQVDGYEVMYRKALVYDGSAELDVLIQNRNTGGVLGQGGALVGVECKNWKEKADSPSVRLLRDNLNSSRGFAKLGLFFSMSGFTQASYNAAAQDGALVVPVTGSDMPAIWRSKEGITREIERRIQVAVVGMKKFRD